MVWVKAFHIIFVVTWFAAMFYLPRLFIYHLASVDKIGIERFKIMERKLYRMIMTPSAVLTAIFGTWLLILTWETYGNASWLWVKLFAVIALYGYHGYCGRLLREFANDTCRKTETFLRWFNEIPAGVLVIVVILVTVKPF